MKKSSTVAIAAALLFAASGVALARHTGSIDPGKAADIIALDGNPLRDPGALERVMFVMKGGRQVLA